GWLQAGAVRPLQGRRAKLTRPGLVPEQSPPVSAKADPGPLTFSGARLFSSSPISCGDPGPARYLAGVRGVRLRPQIEQKALAALQREHAMRPVPEGRQLVQSPVVGPKAHTPELIGAAVEGSFLHRTSPGHVLALLSQIPFKAWIKPRRRVEHDDRLTAGSFEHRADNLPGALVALRFVSLAHVAEHPG